MDTPEEYDTQHCMIFDQCHEIWWKPREPIIRIYYPLYDETREYHVKELRNSVKILTCSMCNAIRHIEKKIKK